MDDIQVAVDQDGFAIVPEAVPIEHLDNLLAALTSAPAVVGEGYRGGGRDLLRAVPEVCTLAGSTLLRQWIEPLLGQGCFAVRGLLFDKTPDHNWKVLYHQDITIAVRRRQEVPGFGPWSVKAGVPHVHAPAGILEGMLAVRVHLDDCGPDCGPIRVLPGSHRAGIIRSTDVESCRQNISEVSCPVPRGGLLLMRPLLLHASSPATRPCHRRVIHLEYAAIDLPGDLEWRDNVS